MTTAATTDIDLALHPATIHLHPKVRVVAPDPGAAGEYRGAATIRDLNSHMT